MLWRKAGLYKLVRACLSSPMYQLCKDCNSFRHALVVGCSVAIKISIIINEKENTHGEFDKPVDLQSFHVCHYSLKPLYIFLTFSPLYFLQEKFRRKELQSSWISIHVASDLSTPTSLEMSSCSSQITTQQRD